MMLETINATLWVGWALVGIVGGYMAGKLLANGGFGALLNIIFGIASAIAGGYAFLMWFGKNYYGQTISLVGAVVFCGVILCLLNLIFPKKNNEEDE